MADDKGFPVLGVLGIGLGAAGNLMAGNASAASYAAGDKSLRFAGSEAIRRAKYDAWRDDVRAGRLIGEQRATFGATGVELRDTAIDVLADSMAELTLDKMMGIRNARMENQGYQLAADDKRAAAKEAKKAGKIGAITSVVGGVSKLFGI